MCLTLESFLLLPLLFLSFTENLCSTFCEMLYAHERVLTTTWVRAPHSLAMNTGTYWREGSEGDRIGPISTRRAGVQVHVGQTVTLGKLVRAYWSQSTEIGTAGV